MTINVDALKEAQLFLRIAATEMTELQTEHPLEPNTASSQLRLRTALTSTITALGHVIRAIE